MFTSDFVDAIRGQSFEGLAHTLAAAVVIFGGVLGIGLLVVAMFEADLLDELEWLVCTLGLGIAGYGALVFVLGFAPALGKVPLGLISLTAVAAASARHHSIRTRIPALGALAVAGWRGSRTLTTATVVFIAVVFFAGFRPSDGSDEAAYHWAAPLQWAGNSRWTTSPFRFTNGFHLAEVIYTPAAVFESPTAAHWVHTFTLALFGLAVAALARRFGGRGVLALAAAVSVPAAARQAWWAYNDVFSAALMACAFVPLNRGRRGNLAVGLLIAGAISVKPLMVVFLPAILVAWWRERLGASSFLTELRQLVLPVAAPSAIAIASWLAYSRHFVGEWWQRQGVVIASRGDSDYAISTFRIPHIHDVVVMAILPMATAIMGQQEPYGGRTGLVALVFIPVCVVTMWRTRGHLHSFNTAVFVACTAYLIPAVLIVRTRFLLVSSAWIVVVATAAIAYWESRSPRWGRLMRWSFPACVLVTMADTARVAVR